MGEELKKSAISLHVLLLMKDELVWKKCAKKMNIFLVRLFLLPYSTYSNIARRLLKSILKNYMILSETHAFMQVTY